MEKTNNSLIISLGGSAISTKEGLDLSFLKEFRDYILEEIKNSFNISSHSKYFLVFNK